MGVAGGAGLSMAAYHCPADSRKCRPRACVMADNTLI